jgi:hypothetical protein
MAEVFSDPATVESSILCGVDAFESVRREGRAGLSSSGTSVLRK